MLALLFISTILFLGAFLFAAVEWLEPNIRILAAGGAAIANHLLPLF
jgi:hypothetical protein